MKTGKRKKKNNNNNNNNNRRENWEHLMNTVFTGNCGQDIWYY
jgi:hypothetical protein